MTKMIVFMGILCVNVFAFSIEDLGGIKKDNISGAFKQAKTISGFSSEIKSSGRFSIANNEILWHTTKPIISSVKITSDGIFMLQNSDSKNAQEVWVKTSQHYDKSLFLSIMRLDFDALKNNFDFQINCDKNAWNLTLIPKGLIKNIFKSIHINGGEFVKSVVLIESNGDKTENHFIIK